MNRMKLFLRTIIVLIAIAGQNVLAAGNYHVEALIFTINGYDNFASQNGEPGTAGYGQYNQFEKIRPSKAPDKGRSWGVKPLYLNKHASNIRAAGNYNIVSHTAWGVQSKPYSRSAAQSIITDDIDGWVKVFAKSLLFTHMDIVVKGSRIQEKRRLKLDEIHYFDNEKFGVLLTVSRENRSQ